jgi:flavorubredoxin
MRAVVVYESLYGNTHEFSAAIATGVTEAQVDLLRVGEGLPVPIRVSANPE